MAAYTQPIQTALLIFPFLALVLTLPFMVSQYRHYGSIPALRTVIVYSFVFYLMCAWFVTLLPLPSREAVAAMTFNPVQLRPFQFVQDFLRETVLVVGDTSTYLPALRQGVVIQPLFNVLLLLPLGVYLRYYFEKDLKTTAAFSFLLSLFFEITQLTGIYGLYPRSFRLFDVDDLLLNTLGGLVGYAITPLLVFLLPPQEKIDRHAYEKGQDVSLLRRGVAFLVDAVLLTLLSGALSLALGALFSQSVPAWGSYLLFLFYFIGLPAIFSGQTPGKRLVRIAVAGPEGQPPTLWVLISRYGLLYILYPLASYGSRWLTSHLPYWENTPQVYPFAVFGSLALAMVLLLSGFAFALYLVAALFQKKRRLFYERWSDTSVQSTLQSEEIAP